MIESWTTFVRHTARFTPNCETHQVQYRHGSFVPCMDGDANRLRRIALRQIARLNLPNFAALHESGPGTTRTRAKCSDSPLLLEADIGVLRSWSQFDVVDGARSRRRIAVR